MFYNVYKERTSELNYKKQGIKYIKLTMHPEYKINIPLDIIFKLIHATEESPLIKYNPAKKQENIYRLYTDKNAVDGRKIPYLSKPQVFKLMRNIGKSKSVAVVIYAEYENITYNILCEFEENGNIIITADFSEEQKLMTIHEIDKLFTFAINPIISEIKSFLDKNGYKFNLFKTLMDDNVEIIKMDFQSVIEIQKKITIDPILGCLSSIFIVESKNPKRDLELRFKRVSNFNKMNSQEAYIIEKQKQKFSQEEIVEGLVKNYGLSNQDALQLFANFVSQLQIERGNKKEIDIKINPGFKTTIHLNKITSDIIINVENINDILYLFTIPIYLDTFIRITQDKKSTNYPFKNINALCSGTAPDDIVIPDIIAAIEDSYVDQEIPIIEEGEGERDGEEDVIYQDVTDYNKTVNDDDEDRIKNVLDLFDFGEEEEEEEEEEDEEDENGLSGGYRGYSTVGGMFEEGENVLKNIDGMRLTKPNPFAEKMEKNDKILFLTEDQGKFKSYSRTCSSSARRQPVLLTEEEKQRIDREQPGFLTEKDYIKYGSNPDKQYYYTCPRYWCLKTNSPISEEDVKANKCGNVIPRNAKTVPKGAYVYEFFDKSEHGSQDKYIQHYPGFISDGKHPDGLCIPCCFKTWDTPSQMERRKTCANQMKQKQGKPIEPIPMQPIKEEPKKEEPHKEEEEEEDDEKEEEEEDEEPNEKPKEKEQEDNYVIGPEKYPLESGRWGYLPMSIQLFLQEKNANCQISKTNSKIKENHTCFLRHGIQISDNQSFIGVIADILYYGKESVPTISEMKKQIIRAIDIDNYITYQNGNLYSIFKPSDDTDISAVDASKYSSSKLYIKLKNNPELFQRIIASLEKFIDYLRDDNVIIDYTYLWDIVCKPNHLLFPQGINLMMLNIVNNDITNNVELICPTNHYSSEFYEARKPTAFIIKNGDYFEPIYTYRIENKNKTKVAKYFTEYDPHLANNLKAIFKNIIRPFLQDMCKPLSSMPNTYNFKRPILLNELIKYLNKYRYEILLQVVNYQNKVIGLVANNKRGDKGFIPCYPSAIYPAYEYIYMIDTNAENGLLTTYLNNKSFLKGLFTTSKGKVPCNILFKVVDDEHVVGILTETNQFIQVSAPEPLSRVYDEIPILRDSNYIVGSMDKEKPQTMSIDTAVALANKNDVDKERVLYIKNLKLETAFYNAFRNTIRILLNDYKNVKVRENIEKDIKSSAILYYTKLNTIITYLKQLVKSHIIFKEDINPEQVNDVDSCITYDADKCQQNNAYCNPVSVDTKQYCQLSIPKNNLITKTDNEVFYFAKMADELIRYKRINSFIFKQQSYFSFGTLHYNLRENEIIVIQSLLTNEYFEGLIPSTTNKYIQYNTYDTIEPIQSQTYDNEITIYDTQGSKQVEDIHFTPELTGNISSGIWKMCFSKKYQELSYEKSKLGGYYMLIELIKIKTGKTLTIFEIKKELFQEYNKIAEHQLTIINILIQEGKKTLGDQVKSGVLSLKQLIYSDNYFISNFDLWTILSKYKISSILISSKPILLSKPEKSVFVTYADNSNDFVFIICPPLRNDVTVKYKIIQDSNTKNVFLPISAIKKEECIETVNNAVAGKINIIDYLNSFTVAKKTYVGKIKKKLLILDDIIPNKVIIKKTGKKIILVDDDDNNSVEFEPEPVLNIYEKPKQKSSVIINKSRKRKPKLLIVE
jgi:hypothetical protein